jgi:hypothetical protein
MRHPRLVALLFAAAIASGSGLAVAQLSQAHVSGGDQIQSNGSGKCLQPANGSPGAAIVQETCNGTVSQQSPQGISRYNYNDNWFASSSSGLSLDARGGDNDGTPIEQWTCDKFSNELWTFDAGSIPTKDQLASNASHHLDKCISTPGPLNGEPMMLYANTPALPSE